MIETINVHKSYGDLQVLKNINLHIEKSEILAIVGESGTGKSTLLQILSTLDKPSEGKVFFSGLDLATMKGNKLAKFRSEHIGFVFQFHNLLPEFNALENVCLPAYLAKKKQKPVEEKAKEILHILGMSERLKHLPSEMSGGEQQRVAIARALINSPTVIFADEPSGNLDPRNSEELHQLFFRLREEFQQTFVVVTHNENLANISDRKVKLDKGSIVKDSHKDF